jgi:hypothetical protein
MAELLVILGLQAGAFLVKYVVITVSLCIVAHCFAKELRR